MMAARWRDWLIGLVPPLVVLALLALASGYAVYWRFYGEEAADERALREWLEEARVFRKTLPELCREYLQVRSPEQALILRQELNEQLQALAAPLRQYTTHLPLFPALYRLELHLQRNAAMLACASQPAAEVESSGGSGEATPFAGPATVEVVIWDSGLLFVPQQARQLEHVLVQDRAGEVRAVVWYQLHAFHHQQRLLAQQQRFTWGMVGLVAGVSFVALAWVSIYSWRQRTRERLEAEAHQRLEQARRQALENQLRLEETERKALELRSQMFASMAILAGSYAHNIKNLLVRPNALLRRCLEQPLEENLRPLLEEVEATLGTVTDRLHEIVCTVRRDPNPREMALIDLNELAREVYRQWKDWAQERWKVDWHLELAKEALSVCADRSQLEQAVENLIFNARDATFEKRGVLRERAHALTNGESRKQALLQAVAWRGEITLATYRLEQAGNADARPGWAVLEVRDNGVGMSPEVCARCTEPYFTTKRDNAAYEGQTTGAGLGLAFVRTIITQHGGRLDIESEPESGTRMRLILPLSTGRPAESPAPHYNHTPP
ncbi:MAG: ATP-binding protein [Gemmatales bacterium]|nr:ATP-binding protein [Gemmatales bacterium]